MAGSQARNRGASGEPAPSSENAGLAVACVVIPHFQLRVEILRHPELDGLPLALTDLAGPARRAISDCSPEATQEGIRPGMPLRDAVNACPHATILTSDPVYYANVFADLLRALGAVSPGIEASELGIVWVDLRGLKRLYGGPEQAAEALLRAVPPILRPRVGLAGNKFTARVAANQARPGGYRSVPPAFAKAFLANAPVSLLPVPDEMKRRLERFGLYELRDIARLPMSKLQAQFGPDGRRAWELAQGRDDARITPIAWQERVIERLTMPAPSVQIEMVMLGLHRLVERIYGRPELRNRGVRTARLQLLLEERRSWEKTFALKGTVHTPHDLNTTLRYRLTGLQLEGAVEEIVLELSGLSTIAARQEQLFGQGARQRHEANMREAARSLRQRYGDTPLYRATPLEPWSRIPERRWGLLGYE
ncbi:MAG: DNA polymerase [Chloroflexi bacterium]|nr:MAG: DNA polymerase [Chloroflexota bacterium]